ncbi:MAG TPA: septal ring lytic transglycosylase RlpA family protein [Burkholderiales bacterium]|nr:septal ring lytic transglycosylase RlpA family protein [Burkholderiales bacterium]
MRRYPALILAVLFAAVVAGCGGGTSTRPSGGTKPGGYYLDDGPGANPPADLDARPEPVPRVEPLNKYTGRPYTVLGRTYTPFTRLTPYRQRGIASWYGKRYHGQKTSSGEVYDMYGFTAAHTILPLPSYARVTNVTNGRSVVVRVNDRGPFHEDRLIDLSYAAAHRLGLIGQGSGLVEVEALLPGGEPAPAAVAPAPASPAPAAVAPPVAAERGGLFVQLGAFSAAENADAFLRKLRLDLAWLGDAMQVHRDEAQGVGMYKVQAGPYATRAEAEAAAERVRKELGFKAFVLNR